MAVRGTVREMCDNEATVFIRQERADFPMQWTDLEQITNAIETAATAARPRSQCRWNPALSRCCEEGVLYYPATTLKWSVQSPGVFEIHMKNLKDSKTPGIQEIAFYSLPGPNEEKSSG